MFVDKINWTNLRGRRVRIAELCVCCHRDDHKGGFTQHCLWKSIHGRYLGYVWKIKLIYHSSLNARRLRGAAILRVKEPALSCLGTAHLHAFVSQHRLARARNHTPLRRRIERFKSLPEGGACPYQPMTAQLSCLSQDSVWKCMHPLAYLSPLPPSHACSNNAAFLRVGESGSRPDLFMFMGFRRDSREAYKQIFIGKKWFDWGQVVSPCQIYEAPQRKSILFLFPSITFLSKFWIYFDMNMLSYRKIV